MKRVRERPARDERCVPPDDRQSNFRMAHESLLSRVPVPAGHIHRIRVERQSPQRAAQAHEQTLQSFFKKEAPGRRWEFDLTVLGLGEDGHVVSLFPDSIALRDSPRLVVKTAGGDPLLLRVTLTPRALNRSAAKLLHKTPASSHRPRPVLPRQGHA